MRNQGPEEQVLKKMNCFIFITRDGFFLDDIAYKFYMLPACTSIFKFSV